MGDKTTDIHNSIADVKREGEYAPDYARVKIRIKLKGEKVAGDVPRGRDAVEVKGAEQLRTRRRSSIEQGGRRRQSRLLAEEAENQGSL